MKKLYKVILDPLVFAAESEDAIQGAIMSISEKYSRGLHVMAQGIESIEEIEYEDQIPRKCGWSEDSFPIGDEEHEIHTYFQLSSHCDEITRRLKQMGYELEKDFVNDLQQTLLDAELGIS